MASMASTALLLSLNLFFFALVSANDCPPSLPSQHTPYYGTPSWRTPSLGTPSQSTPAAHGSCQDAIKLGVCANVLGGLVDLSVGQPPKEPCCSVINGLLDLEAAACICTAIKADILGIIHLDLHIQASLLLNYCGKEVPSGFQCA